MNPDDTSHLTFGKRNINQFIIGREKKLFRDSFIPMESTIN
jgi:hypothetical protein